MALTDQLITYYKMEGNSNDSVGSSNGTDTAITYSLGNGKILQGAGFNGTTSQILSTIGGNSTFTVNCWARANTTASGGSQTVWEQRDAGNTVDYDIAFGATGNILLESFTPYLFVAGTSILSNATYYMITAIVSGASSAIYINGVSDGVGTLNTFTSGTQFYLGQNAGGTQLTGAVDEVGYWTRALSGAEITQLYNGGAGLTYPFTPGAVASHNLSLIGVGS